MVDAAVEFFAIFLQHARVVGLNGAAFFGFCTCSDFQVEVLQAGSRGFGLRRNGDGIGIGTGHHKEQWQAQCGGQQMAPSTHGLEFLCIKVRQN